MVIQFTKLLVDINSISKYIKNKYGGVDNEEISCEKLTTNGPRNAYKISVPNQYWQALCHPNFSETLFVLILS